MNFLDGLSGLQGKPSTAASASITTIWLSRVIQLSRSFTSGSGAPSACRRLVPPRQHSKQANYDKRED
jgi:hypothetical protein